MPLRRLMIRLIFLSLLPTAALAVVLGVMQVQLARADRDRQASSLASTMSRALDQHLMARVGGMRTLAGSTLFDTPGRRRDLYAEALAFRTTFDGNVILATTDGRMLFDTVKPYGAVLPPLPRPKGRSAALIAAQTGRPAVGNAFFAPILHRQLVAIAVPAVREGKVAALLLNIFGAREIEDFVNTLALPSGWALTVRDSAGTVIAWRGPAWLRSQTPDPAAFTVRSARSPLSDWTLSVFVPRTIYEAPVRKLAGLIGLALVLATLIGFAGAWMTSRKVANAVASLAQDGSPDGRDLDIEEVNLVRKRLDDAAAQSSLAEQRLRASQAQLRIFVQTAPISIAMLDRELRYIAYSERWRIEYGRGWDDLVGRGHYAVHPDIPVSWRNVHQRALAGETVRNDRDVWTYADGSLHWLRWVVLPWRDEAGAIGGIIISAEDITPEVRAQQEVASLNASLERRVTERTAELSAANAELDAFAYAVSHDLRGPLRALNGFSQALIEEAPASLGDDARMYLTQIGAASLRMGALIDGILALSRSTRGELVREMVDASALAVRHLETLRRTDPTRTVVWSVEPGLTLRGDPRMLDAAIGNLLENAWKYTSKVADARIRVYGGASPGQARFCVEDNGAGFDMAHAQRLFKPFQRLHRQEEFPGMGIGLATVARIARRHGGDIEAHGVPGEGARFCLVLPDG